MVVQKQTINRGECYARVICSQRRKVSARDGISPGGPRRGLNSSDCLATVSGNVLCTDAATVAERPLKARRLRGLKWYLAYSCNYPALERAYMRGLLNFTAKGPLGQPKQ